MSGIDEYTHLVNKQGANLIPNTGSTLTQLVDCGRKDMYQQSTTRDPEKWRDVTFKLILVRITKSIKMTNRSKSQRERES